MCYAPKCRLKLRSRRSHRKAQRRHACCRRSVRERRAVLDRCPVLESSVCHRNSSYRRKQGREGHRYKPQFEVKFFLAKHAADVGVSRNSLKMWLMKSGSCVAKTLRHRLTVRKLKPATRDAVRARKRAARLCSVASRVCPMSGVHRDRAMVSPMV
jgi:hypothetical protein